MSAPDEQERRGSGRILLSASIILAVAAAVVLALGADDPRLLRLGIVAALWAALLGAFTAVRRRRDGPAIVSRSDELRTHYQLELEREIAARREHEQTVERDLRERFHQEERAEIAALRDEIAALRASLQQLTAGDLMVERVALRAESTRLRPLVDPRTSQPDRFLPAGARTNVVTADDWLGSGSRPHGNGGGPGRRHRPDPQPREARTAGARHTAEGTVPHRAGPNGAGPNGDGASGRTAGRRRAPEVASDQRSGAHSGGLSVDALLAAHGGGSSPRRRHRRDED